MKILLKSFRILSVIVLGLITGLTTYSQKAPVKFGKIDRADLEMKVYPQDTSASAVVLCDYGSFNSNEYQFTRLFRVKILKKEGTSWGSCVYPGWDGCFIRGITYNLENSEIIETKLKSESIFKERVFEDYYRYRVAMPKVKEGSVIDIEFTINGFPREWLFQQEIPVRWSELCLDPNSNRYRKSPFGFESLSESSNYRWVAKNMPAFKKEPFMNEPTNYITKFEFESNPPSWEYVNNILLDHPYFGKVIKGCFFLNSVAKEINARYTDPVEKIKAAQDIVKKTVKWDLKESVLSTHDGLVFPWKDKIGNSADINLTLIALLRKININVKPVVLSTRSNGFLPLAFPSFKFNYVIAYVIVGENKYFVDATEDFLPAGLLPERCINLKGRIVDEISSDWVNLIPQNKEKRLVQADLRIENDLSISGKYSEANYDYAAFNFRKNYEKFNSQEAYLKDYENNHHGLRISNFQLVNFDSIYLPVKQSYDLKLTGKVTSSGNIIYLNPMLYEQLTENPFKTEVRKYPVDFMYTREIVYSVKITLPEKAEVSEIPKTLTMKLPDNSASVKYQITKGNDYLLLIYRYTINKPIFSEIEYSDIRIFFSEMIKKHSEPIAIKML